MPAPTMLTWTIDDTDGFDTAWASVDGRRLVAEGRAVGLRPEPYWMTYRLETDDAFVHRRLVVEARTAAGSTHLDLRREDGTWTVDGTPRRDLEGALDCDLAECPLTNTMPILRHGLHRGPGDHHLLMAFVQVPSLRVVPSEQRYTHLTRRGDGAIVQYRSGSFESDLVIDGDGFVVDYPQLGRRIASAAPRPPASGRSAG